MMKMIWKILKDLFSTLFRYRLFVYLCLGRLREGLDDCEN
jgi:hypothetical protein